MVVKCAELGRFCSSRPGRWQESRVCLWYRCRAAVTTAVAETVYATDTTMCVWGVRASRLVFGWGAPLKKLRNRELCGASLVAALCGAG